MSDVLTVGGSGYNQDFIREAKKKSRRKTLGRFFVVLVPLLLISYFVLEYVSRLPRERQYRNAGFFERVKLGFNRAMRGSYLVLMADHDDAKNSKLPIVELYMRGERIDKLTEDLPQSGRKYQKANLKIDNKEYKVSARFRGDSINHWAFPHRSWRIRLEKDKFYEGMQYFNLNVPRVKTQVSNWLGYEIARSFPGLLVPQSDYVHFRLNRMYDGVRLFLEQVDQEFLRRRNLPPGKIFVGDIGFEHIYGAVPRKHIYKETDAWQVRSAYEADMGRSEMQELLRIIREEHNPYRFYDSINQLVNVDAMLSYMALLELVGSVHVDETHNGKFYFNPVTGKLNPIVWDTVAYFWKTKGLDLASNSLFRVLLSNPEFRERKDQLLWDMVHGAGSTANIQKLAKEKVDQIRPDIYAFALKLHANDKGIKHISNSEWEEALVELNQSIANRNTMIKQHLRDTAAVYRLVPNDTVDNKYRLAVQVASAAGVKLASLRLKLDSPVAGKELRLTRVGLSDIGSSIDSSKAVTKAVTNERGVAAFKLDDHLYSKRRFAAKRVREQVPATYVFELEVEPGHKVEKIVKFNASNSITKEPFALRASQDVKVPAVHKVNSVWWQPDDYTAQQTVTWSGSKILTKNFVVDRHTKLVIEPGTVVRLAENTSIIVNGGQLKAIGSKGNPVKFVPYTGAPWGVIASSADASVAFDFVEVVGGSEAVAEHTRYQEALSFYNSKVRIQRSKFIDSAISAHSSELTVANVEFSSPRKELVYSEHSNVKLKQVKKLPVNYVHGQDLLNKTGHGTPRRTEREFKFKIFGQGTETIEPSDLAWEVHQALDQSIGHSDWKAPEFTNTNYFHDKAVKDFVFRDFYFDTEDRLAEKHAISYRYRNRYSGMKSYNYHVKNQNWSKHWPYRLEYQAKVNREELGGGFSSVEEARFEFRKESKPFSASRLPPAPPWDLEVFIPYFKAGNYKGLVTYPAQEVIRELNTKEGEAAKEAYAFEPRLVLLTERFRQHFNIKSPWGSGPNPEQAYIISLDHSIVYDSKSYLEYLQARKYGEKKRKAPPEVGTLLEIEVEFERNVSDKLDQELRLAKQENRSEDLKRLEAARDAFLSDQQHIMEVIKEYFSDKDIKIEPVSKSKYVQAAEFLH